MSDHPAKVKIVSAQEANSVSSLAALTRNFKPVQRMIRIKAKRSSVNAEDKYR